MDLQLQALLRRFVAGDIDVAPRALSLILRTQVDFSDEKPSRPWGTIPYDPNNPPRTPNDLYMMKPKRVTGPNGEFDMGLNRVFPYAEYLNDFWGIEDEKATLVRIHYYIEAEPNRRAADFGSLFFRGEPVGLFNVVEDARDKNKKFFISNEPLFNEMVAYLNSFIRPDDDREDLIDPDSDAFQNEGVFEMFGKDVRDYLGED